jgi:hypothetical protein
MRKLHFTPSEERDTAPFIESVIVLFVLGGIVFLIWLCENLN